MNTDWYYANSGERAGPVTESEFLDLRRSGQIGAQTLVWREGMTGWQPLSEAIAAAASSSPDDGSCTVCGRNVGTENLIVFQSSRVCADCKDGFFRRVREQGVSDAGGGAGSVRFAGFWIRLLALFLDYLTISAVTWPLTIAFFAFLGIGNMPNNQAADPAAVLLIFGRAGVFSLVLFILQAAYQGWFLAKRGGTPGKLILGLRVMRSDGGGLTFWRGIGRYFAFTLSTLILYIGCIMAAFDDEKRALHDRICDTRVIYKNP